MRIHPLQRSAAPLPAPRADYPQQAHALGVYTCAPLHMRGGTLARVLHQAAQLRHHHPLQRIRSGVHMAQPRDEGAVHRSRAAGAASCWAMEVVADLRGIEAGSELLEIDRSFEY